MSTPTLAPQARIGEAARILGEAGDERSWPKSREVAVLDAHQVYRRSQRYSAAGAGDVMKAQSRLWHHLEPFTRTSTQTPDGEPDVDAIDDAVDALVASVEWHCGPETAAYVAGDEGGEQE